VNDCPPASPRLISTRSATVSRPGPGLPPRRPRLPPPSARL
jgi:hypothetical protein